MTKIGASAFSGCKHLTSVAIPEGVTEIEKKTFEGCTNLASITVPSSVMLIGELAFANCEKLTVTCPQDSYAWNYCKIRGIPVRA